MQILRNYSEVDMYLGLDLQTDERMEDGKCKQQAMGTYMRVSDIVLGIKLILKHCFSNIRKRLPLILTPKTGTFQSVIPTFMPLMTSEKKGLLAITTLNQMRSYTAH